MYFTYADVIITNGPMEAQACIGDSVNIPCGFANVAGSTPINWRIIRRDSDGSVNSDVTQTGIRINTIDLNWIIDRPGGMNHSNSVLVVGPVNEFHNQSSYQCYFSVFDNNNTLLNVTSNVGTLTVYG